MISATFKKKISKLWPCLPTLTSNPCTSTSFGVLLHHTYFCCTNTCILVILFMFVCLSVCMFVSLHVRVYLFLCRVGVIVKCFTVAHKSYFCCTTSVSLYFIHVCHCQYVCVLAISVCRCVCVGRWGGCLSTSVSLCDCQSLFVLFSYIILCFLLVHFVFLFLFLFLILVINLSLTYLKIPTYLPLR